MNRAYGQEIDPLKFASLLWPQVRFYNKQVEVIHSVLRNRRTFVPAGNQLGKDFVSAFIALWFFLTRHPCRIVTTSAREEHLRILWGEIGWFISNCKCPLDVKRGGPLLVNHQNIRKSINGQVCGISFLSGMV